MVVGDVEDPDRIKGVIWLMMSGGIMVRFVFVVAIFLCFFVFFFEGGGDTISLAWESVS